MKQITVNNKLIELEKKRIKNMYLRVLPPDGRIHITAPIRMKEEEILHFIFQKMDWVERQQKKLENKQTNQEINYLPGDEISFKGEKYILSLIEKPKHHGISLNGKYIELYVQENSTRDARKKILDKWHREALMADILPLLTKWENLIGVKAAGYTVRDMKTRWGTCNIRTRNICFNLQLAKKPPKCLEYIVVHELVHFLEKSHNHIFKGYLDRFLPEWRSIKKELNGIGQD